MHRPRRLWLAPWISLALGACATPTPPADSIPPQAVVAADPSADASPVSAPVPMPSRAASKPATRKPARPVHRRDGPGDRSPDSLVATPDAVPRREPLAAAANRPYVLYGTRYQPLNRVAAFAQRGKASWYGSLFHGRRTANGERYDMYAMTAAHPTLPIPSYVRVTLSGTGQSVVVRINDRGPFLAGRAIDLSYAAAAKLGMTELGTADVEIASIVIDDPGPLGAALASADAAPRTVRQGLAAGGTADSGQRAEPVGAPGGKRLVKGAVIDRDEQDAAWAAQWLAIASPAPERIWLLGVPLTGEAEPLD